MLRGLTRASDRRSKLTCVDSLASGSRAARWRQNCLPRSRAARARAKTDVSGKRRIFDAAEIEPSRKLSNSSLATSLLQKRHLRAHVNAAPLKHQPGDLIGDGMSQAPLSRERALIEAGCIFVFCCCIYVICAPHVGRPH